MRDLIRSYKMKLKRKPSVSDSDTESQPLVSSASSTTSFGTLNERCMFQHDSDLTDESEKNSQDNSDKKSSSGTPVKSFIRRPFCYPGPYEVPPLDVYTTNEAIYDRFQYFNKVNALITEDSLIAPKILSPYKSYEHLDSDDNSTPTQSSLVTICVTQLGFLAQRLSVCAWEKFTRHLFPDGDNEGFAVWNTIMGSSLLAMAWGLEKAGLIPGILLILFISGICLYTSYVILKVNECHGLFKNNEVPDLCRILLGRWAEAIAKVFSLIVLIGANIVYWILMSNFLYHSVRFLYGYFFSLNDAPVWNSTVMCPKDFINTTVVAGPKVLQHQTFDHVWDLYTTVPLFLAVLMFPLLNFKSATFFTKFNSLGTISVAYLLIFVAVKSFSWGIHIPDWGMEFNIKSNFCALSGMLSLSFFIHNIIISIMKNNKRQEKNGRDLSIAFGLVTFTYLFIGVLFYICFPLAKSCIEDNLLNNFQKHDVMSIIARVLLLFQLFTVFPLMAYMLRMDVLNNINMIFKDSKYGDFTYWRVICLNLVVVAICILFACFLPRIGTLIRYTGALSGMVYIFTLPSLLKIASLKKQNALTPCQLIVHMLIFLIGCLNLGFQFFISDA